MTETHLFSGDQFYATTDTCYLDSGNPNNNYQGYDWDLISDGSTTTRMGIMMFKIPDRSSAIVQPISDKAYISQIDLKLDISNAGASLYFWPLSSSHTSAMDFALATYSRPGILGDSSNIKWNPASWSHIDPSHTTTVLIGGNMLGQLVVSSTGVKTFSITPEMLKILGADFGSTVYLAVYASSNNNVIVDWSDSSIEMKTKETPPDIATLTSAVSSDGLSANLSVKVPNDNSITEFYLEAASSAGISATASGDYIQGQPKINETEVVPMASVATLTQGANKYVRVFTENDEHANASAQGGNEIVLFRPQINAAVIYTDSALSSAIANSKENVTLGQKVYLKVTNSAVGTASTGNKYTKLRVNWDSGSSDTDEDYSTYDMVDLTPVLHNGSNTVVSHRYHSAGAKVVKVQVEDENGFRSDKTSLTGYAVDVKTGLPTAVVSPSRTKVTTAKYGDRTTAVTLSGQQSRTSGSNISIEHYGWGYTAGAAQTIVTANALENDNSIFDDNSKRVKIASLANVDVDDTVFKIFGLASFTSAGVGVKDTDTTNFDHYAYTSATASPLTFDEDARPNIGSEAVDSAGNHVYFKEIECVVCTTKAGNENSAIYDSQRYVLLTSASDEDSSASQVINSDLRYDSNVAASLIDSTDNVGETYTATDEILTRSGATVTDHPEVIRINNEDLFIHHESSNDVLVIRGYNGTTATAHDSGDAINVYRLPSRYRWGGYAMIQGTNIDFASAGTIDIGDGLFDENCSAGNEKDWFAQGFYIGDIIKVGNTAGSNGTYDSPKYYKIKTITASGASSGNDYDIVTIETDSANLTEEEQTYVSTSLTTDANELPVIVRDDSAKKPSITAAIYNTANNDDTVTFYMGIFDSTQSRFSAQDKSSTTTNHNFSYHWSEDTVDVRAVTPTTLDLDTLADASNIAIEKVNITRSGGISSQMPLGIRRYPVGVTRTKLGIPKVSIQAKALDQTGYRALFSLVEGNRYDYVFLDSKKLDSPTVSYRTLRMRLESGNITKDTSDPNVYVANLNFVILGEDVS